MGLSHHLTCLLRNLYVGQEARVRTLYGTTDWFRIEKGVQQSCLLSPCLFNLYTECIMRNAGLGELQAGIKIDGRKKHQQSQIHEWYHSNSRKQRGTKESFDEGEGGEWKSRLKTKYWKTKIMASGPITVWQIKGEKVEIVTDFLYLGCKITMDGDRSHEIRR